jgi:predicted O-methyltransferase YrrM
MLKYVEGAKSILEIGSRFGESIYRMARCASANARIVCIDMPNADDCVLDAEGPLRARIAEIAKMGHETHLFLGDSHSSGVIEAVTKLGPFDFLFIDGDHSEAGVRQDWEAYSPLAKVIAFHDICGTLGCVTVWNELKQRYRTVEFRHSGWMGIGVLFKD